MNNKVRQWDKRRDTSLITLRFPATPEEIQNFLTVVDAFGEPWDEQVRYDPEEGWMYVEYEMGTGMSPRKEEQ